MNTKPGAIDLQVNGYAGVDFNADRTTAADFRAACESLRADDVACILATVITDSLPAMSQRLANIVNARQADSLVAEMIIGIHIEGPFLNREPGYIGAHPPEHARPAAVDDMRYLLEAAAGLAKIVTLAPECDSGYAVTKMLVNDGIVVSAGHCNPSLDQLRGAMDAGLSMVTHLGNGCPMLLHRHDNFIQRVLSISDRLMIGFIADGVHVPFHALRNYLKCVGLDNAFIVTDAIMAAGQGPGRYDFGGQAVVVDDQLATWVADKSHLVGSAVTMPRVRKNLADLGFDDGEIDRLIRKNPAKAIDTTSC